MSTVPMFRRRTVLATPLALALAHPLLGGASAFAQDAAGGTLTGGFDVGPGGAPELFNPLTLTAGMTWVELYFQKLMVYDVDFTGLQGNLAETWEVSEDGLTYTLGLRQGVKWHDGEDFTADDVKFTFDLVRNPESGSFLASKFTQVTSVDVVDDHTVTLSLSEPNAGLPDAITFLAMLPEHKLGEMAPADLIQSTWWSTEPVGTGPFKWGQYVPGEYVELVANPDYWGGAPKLEKVINRYYKEPGTAVIALRSGELDFTYITSDEAAALASESNISQIAGPSQVINYVAFNFKDPRFEDVRVRQAFMYAIDRVSIIDQLYGGTAQKAYCAFSLPQFIPEGLNEYEYDPEMAKQLLDEAGWADIKGEPMEMLTYYSDQLSSDVMVTIQQMLADVGVEVTLRAVDVPTFNQTMQSAEWVLFYGGAGNGPDPDVNSVNMVSTMTPPTGNNRTYINMPELDDLFAQGRAATDADSRAGIYQDACGVMNENIPWAFMWVGERYGAHTDRVTNFTWTPAPGGGRYDQKAQEWTVASE